MPVSDWPFDQPPDCAVISLKSIVFDDAPVLYVSHDEDDHGWQFLDGGALDVESAAVVSLQEMVDRDPTLLGISDLPPGWSATRANAAAAWKRHQT